MSQNVSIPRMGIHSLRAQCLLMVFWALLGGLAYPAPNFWLLAHLAPLPLVILATRGVTTRRTMAVIGCGAVVWWIWMLRWMMPVTLPGAVALGVYTALFTLGFAATLRRIARKHAWPMVILLPLVWTAFEYLRGALVVGGFPWFGLGHSQPAVLIQIADATGAYGVSFFVAMTSGLIYDMLTRPLVEHRDGQRRWGMPIRWSWPIWAVSLSITLVYGGWRIWQTDRAMDPSTAVRVAVVQTNVRQSNKDSPDPADRAASFQQLVDLIEAAARDASHKPDLIICPETMVPRPIDDESVRLLPESRSYRMSLDGLSKQLGIPLIVGAHAMTDWRQDPTNPGYATPSNRFNSAYLITPESGVTARYDKLHRVPFGEYLPGVESVPALKRWLLQLSPYDHDYTLSAGEKPVIFDVALPRGGQVAVGAPICFEDALGYLPKTLVWDGTRKRAMLLVNLTNDGWFQGTHQAAQHEQIARFRCVENRVPMARSVNTGVSGMIDAAGRIVERVVTDGAREGVAGVASAALHRDLRRTIYAVLGDGFAMLCLWVTVVLGCRGIWPVAPKSESS